MFINQILHVIESVLICDFLEKSMENGGFRLKKEKKKLAAEKEMKCHLKNFLMCIINLIYIWFLTFCPIVQWQVSLSIHYCIYINLVCFGGS